MKKNMIKIALDIVMTVLLIMMYNAKIISLTFHELGGLIACGLFFIHNLLNAKWISRVTQRLFDKSLPVKTKLGYIVDMLLLAAVLCILISGIMISKILFPSGSFGGSANQLHYFASAAAVILVGIHVGLHWPFISGMFKKHCHIKKPISIILSAILLTAIVGFGSYSLATTQMTDWLSAPFTAASGHDGGYEHSVRVQTDAQPSAGASESSSDSSYSYGQKGDGMSEHARGGGPSHSGNGSTLSAGRVLELLASFGSIIGLFATGAYWLERLIRKLSRPRTPQLQN